MNAANGIQGIPDTPPNGGLTQINITGLNQLGGHNNLPVDEINGNSQFHDNISRQWGKHSLKAGFEMQRVKVAVFSAQFPHGYFVYSGQYTTVPGGNAAGTGIAQFAIQPVSSIVANGINYEGGANQVEVSPLGQEDYRRPYYGTFLQDNWAVTRRLTINLGIRWEYYPLPHDNYGADANFVPGTPFVDAAYLRPRWQSTPLSPSFMERSREQRHRLSYR